MLNCNETDELMHYGVLGMKWGVRRFQDRNGHLATAGLKQYNQKHSDSNGDESKDKSKKIQLTDKQKKAIKIGAAVVGTALVTYGAYKIGSKHLRHLKNVGEMKVDDLLDNNGFKLLKEKPSSMADQLKFVNPSKSNTNCRACSIASILRFRGYDVEAIGSVEGGSLREAVEGCFKEPKITEMYEPSKDRVSKYILKKFDEGSSGAMAAGFKTAYGSMEHAFNWMVKDGKVLFTDGQSGMADFSDRLNLLDPDKMAEIVRLDDLEINVEGLKKFIKNR